MLSNKLLSSEMKNKELYLLAVKMIIAYLIAYFLFVGKYYLYECKLKINLFCIEPEKYFVIALTILFVLVSANEVKKHLTK